jgi:hypothetical protein
MSARVLAVPFILLLSALCAGPAAAATPNGGLLDLVGCGGLLEPICPDGAAGTPGGKGVTMTLRASRSVLPTNTSPIPGSGKRVVLSGKVSGVPNPGDLVVSLHERVPAYDLSNTRQGEVNDRGKFEFSAQPSANTAYRVSIPDGQGAAGASHFVGVFVVPTMNLDVAPDSSPGKASFSVTVGAGNPVSVGSHSTPVKSHTVKSFLYSVEGKRAHRRSTIQVKESSDCGTFSYCSAGGSKTLRVTKTLQKAKGFIVCFPEPVWIGLGSPARDCGDKSVRMP